MISLPTDWLDYYITIKERCANLIRFKIWNGIELDNLDAWLLNFTSDQEKYLSACILDSLMYRSNSQTKALLYHLFNIVLPNYSRNTPTRIGVINDWLEKLQSKNEDFGIRLVAVVTEFDPPTKSTYHILRMLAKEFSVNEAWITTPDKLKYHVQDGAKVFLFLDDFMGSGEQFEDLILEYNLHQQKDVDIYFTPLVAHSKGCNYLEKTYGKSINVVFSEFLDESINFFLTRFASEPDVARQFYIEMLERRNIKSISPRNAFGFGNLEFAYAFEHACPDNSLTALWRSNEHWQPLFKR